MPVQPGGRRPRRPAVAVAMAVAAGIVCDRYGGLPWPAWLQLATLALAAWGLCIGRRWRGAGVVALLAAWLCLGAARHHAVWSVAAPHDLALSLSDEWRPVRLEGTILSDPVLRPRDRSESHAAWPQTDQTWCDIDCAALVSGGRRLSVCGRARLRVGGSLSHVNVGDRIEVRGWMGRPQGPANPGEFDYGEYLRRQGIRGLVSAETPEAVIRLDGGRRGDWRREISRLRGHCRAAFARYLDSEQAAIATALLFGDRSGLDIDRQMAFAESGTMHVLAVSGLHVGILVAFCWCACRLLNLSRGTTTAAVLAAVVLLALLADARPPVVRAGVLAALLLMGRQWSRRADGINSLAVAALVVLLWSPTDLFDVGAQLSFLAVMGILWSNAARAARRPTFADDEDSAEDPLRRLLRAAAAWLGPMLRMSFGIWVWTAPLIAWSFHLVSPVGLVANLVLVPLATLILWIGYLLLLGAAVAPPLAVPLGWGMRAGLWVFAALVRESAALEPGHVFVPGPPMWWLVGWYALLLVCGRARLAARPALRWGLVCCGLVVGLAAGLVPSRSVGLRCTFLSVGHGGAVLVECPNGRTLLYDAGAIDNARRAQRIVQQALWARGHVAVDALVVSHADIDHMNAVPGLLRTIPIGSLLTAQAFLDFDQPAVAEVCESASAAGVPIRLIQEQDRIGLDAAVSLGVLHPPAGYGSQHDNANSLTLQIEYAGRRILLTGDLERGGLDRMLRQPPRAIDVLQSPHHGSPAPNSATLARWAAPQLVVVCTGRTRALPHLRRTYGPTAPVWSTGDCGAVTVTITPEGHVHTESVRRIH